ncbi:DUF4270 domain-containing protein [Flavobacterium sp. 5]|uniref:DUF4270 domain-containing protein n=1 Tax=Flavobacterium sp. 5 TaxID=2035199 RepID=UPI000C2C6FB5|nr:DUF4270 domain-containing protein [Flavobacterium sp. 5]PKB16514.1 uncharacterized protein DUF4270 [Flavobacterium sp. 5]
MLRNSFFKIIPFLFFIVLFNSCDKEFNVIGEDLIGDNSFGIKKEEFPVVGYNQKIGPIQSNNMDINPLGVYKNSSFGTTKANFVTQVALATVAPDIDESAVIVSAVLTIPYFSTLTGSNADGNTYELDSIYGPSKAKMNLKIYESNYYMRDLDPEEQLTQPQKYYTNQYSEFFTQKGDLLYDSSADLVNDKVFFFDPKEIVVKDVDNVVTSRTVPGMKLNLNTAFFQNKILKASDASLANNAAFKEYFRGLFFDIENIDAEGNMAMLNFKGGKITITYNETISEVITEKTLVIQLSGNTVSLLDQSNPNQDYTDSTPINPDETYKANGDDNLYLKGGEGSMSVLKLFSAIDNHGLELSEAPNGVPDELDDMRRNKYLINEADLIFHLNSEAMGNNPIPQRIYLYDFTNKQILIDYLDNSAASNPKNDKFVFGGIINKDTDANGGGYYYKFRITNYIRSLVKNTDSTNVDLGLVVTENINKSAFYSLRDKTQSPFKVPMASVMNPLGTIVYGNNVADEKKRLKFVVYYTKAN